MSPTIVDFMGEVLRLGDTVVYPVRRGSEMVLKSAVVSETPCASNFASIRGVHCLNSEGRRVIIQRPERCVIVQRLERPDADVSI